MTVPDGPVERSVGASWPAPAKINLFLHVTGRRSDGYHDLQTIFRFVDLADELDFTVRRDGRLRRLEGADGVAETDDLVWRAARLLQDETGCGLGADIRVRKRIPMGAGLGGGSSDAATTLVALNMLWGCGLGRSALQRLGGRLGADVPVFVHGRAAWAEGRGEVFRPVHLPPAWYLLVCPPCRIATADVFGDPELTRDCRSMTMGGFLSGQAVNVCEAVVRRRHPVVGEVLDWLGRYGRARMSGTGASCFVEMPDEGSAKAALEALPVAWAGWVVEGLDRSPLMDRASAAGSAPES